MNPITTTPVAGDVLYSSWGYEQTNVNWYVVLKSTIKSVQLQEIAGEVSEYSGAGMSGACVPDRARTIGKPFVRRLMHCSGASGAVARINSSAYVYRWDGRPQRFTTYA